MAYLSTISAYVPSGVDSHGRPRHLLNTPSDMLSVHEMVELAARQIDPSMRSAAGSSLAASFHCGSFYQGEHFWPVQNSLQQSVLGVESSGAAAEIRQFCSGGLFGVMLADAVLDAGWGGDYAMVTGGDSNFFFDRYEYANSAATEGSLMGDSGFCAILNRRHGFARILSVEARSHNPSADMMHSREDHGIDTSVFPALADWIARFTEHDRRHPGLAAHNARASFQTAINAVTACYQRVGIDPSEINWFAPSFIEPSYVTDMLAKQCLLQPNPGLYSFGAAFGHLTVSDFCLNLIYFMNKKIAKVGDLVMLYAAGNFVNSVAILIRIEKEVSLPFNIPL